MKQLKIRRICIAGLYMMAVCAFGVAGSASAAPLLFVPHSGKFPYHLTGVSGKTELEQKAGPAPVTSSAADVLVLVLSPTLFDASFKFLNSTTGIGGDCNNEGSETGTTILLNLLGHLGLAHKGTEQVPAVLLLVPSGFKFTCFGVPIVGSVGVLVRGAVIGQITNPALSTTSETMLLAFNKVAAGTQELRVILLNNELVTADLESSTNEGVFELASQTGEGPLKALPGEGTFLLVSP